MDYLFDVMKKKPAAGKTRTATQANRTAGAIRRAGRGRPRSQESEDAIINATMALLRLQGYGGVTLDKVAARAKASKPTIYRRWPSKEHLVIAAFDRFPPLQAKDKGDVLEELLDLYEQFIAIMHQRPLAGVLPMLAGEWAHNPKLASAMEPLVERRREPITVVLRRAAARGELPAATDIDMANDLVMGPLLQRMFFRRADVGRKSLRKLLQIVLSGLRNPA
jgi:AcrR family transcriptional regulator